jgi:uncharacterized membrane protein YgcG
VRVLDVTRRRVDQDEWRILVLIPQWKFLTVESRKRLLRRKADVVEEAVVRQKVERKVIAYARVKRQLMFYTATGDYDPMPERIVLEVLAPDSRDQQDLDRQVRLDGKQLVVVRWKNKARLLFASDVARVDRGEYQRYWSEHGTTEESGSGVQEGAHGGGGGGSGGANGSSSGGFD